MSNKEADPLKDEKEGKVQEVGSNAVWSISSEKSGFGILELRDNYFETYWQSNGPQPHFVNILFKQKTTICDVCIYADYKQDESYTPNRISVRAGTHLLALQEVEVVDLNEPSGWIIIPLKDAMEQPISTVLVQIAVLSNHQNGRDTRIRQIRIRSPMQSTSAIPSPMPIESEALSSINLCRMMTELKLGDNQSSKRSLELWNQYLVHACQCSDKDCGQLHCAKLKLVLQHLKRCKKKANGGCPNCKMLFALCYYHAKHCKLDHCPTTFCLTITRKLRIQRLKKALQEVLKLKAMIELKRRSQNSQALSKEVDDTEAMPLV